MTVEKLRCILISITNIAEVEIVKLSHNITNNNDLNCLN